MDQGLRELRRQQRERGDDPVERGRWLVGRLRQGSLARADLLSAGLLGDPGARRAQEQLGEPLAPDAELDQRAAVALCVVVGVRVLPEWEAQLPGDPRPRQALREAERWLRGESLLSDRERGDLASGASWALNEQRRRPGVGLAIRAARVCELAAWATANPVYAARFAASAQEEAQERVAPLVARAAACELLLERGPDPLVAAPDPGLTTLAAAPSPAPASTGLSSSREELLRRLEEGDLSEARLRLAALLGDETALLAVEELEEGLGAGQPVDEPLAGIEGREAAEAAVRLARLLLPRGGFELRTEGLEEARAERLLERLQRGTFGVSAPPRPDELGALASEARALAERLPTDSPAAVAAEFLAAAAWSLASPAYAGSVLAAALTSLSRRPELRRLARDEVAPRLLD